MNGLMINILKYLINNTETSLDFMINYFNINKRALLYNLEKINDFISEKKFGEIKIINDNVSLYNVNLNLEYLLNSTVDFYVLCKSERISLITLILLLSEKKFTIDEMAEYLFVSRNTIISEINEIKAELKINKLELIFDKREGYLVKGDEQQIRRYIMVKLNDLMKVMPKSIQKEFINIIFKDENIEGIYEILVNCFKKNHLYSEIYLSTDAIFNIFCYVSVIYMRNKKGYSSNILKYQNFVEFNISLSIIDELNKKDINIFLSEASYISSIILSNKYIEYDMSELTCEDQNKIDKLVNIFELNGLISVQENLELLKMLKIHLRSLIYRLENGVVLIADNSDEIIKKYHKTYLLIKDLIKDYETEFNVEINKDELAYLMIYFGGFLKSKCSSIERKKDKILIVCGSGLGASYLIKQQLSQVLCNEYKYVIMDYYQTLKCKLDEYVTIITSVDLNFQKEYEYIIVDPILTNKQIMKIIDWEKNCYENIGDKKLRDIIHIIDTNATIINSEKLIQDLYKYLSPIKYKSKGIEDVLTIDNINIFDGTYGIEDSTRLCCKRLIEDGCIDNEYCDELVNQLIKEEIFCEYYPGVILAHSHYLKGVSKLSLSINYFRKGIQYNNGNRIYLVIVLGTPNKNIHLDLLKELFKIIYSNEFKVILDAVETIKIEDVKNLYIKRKELCL